MAEQQGIALPAGTEINQYRILSVLGQGGFGVVYQAQHMLLDETVVIKEFLPVELAGRSAGTVVPHSHSKQDLYQDCLRRFMDEGRTLVKLSHRNVVRCRDLFTTNGTAYLVMDYENGLSLDQLIKALEAQGEYYTQVQLLHFLIPLAQGLAYIHDQGVLHRDIKPGNVFIRRHDGSPVIIDFGAAKQNFAVASQSQAPFTEFYAPLEQIEGGGEAKPSIDIHAFGALMYRLVTGTVGPKAEARAMKLLYGEADPLTPCRQLAQQRISDEFAALVDACLAFRASDRPQSMHDVVRRLQALQGTATQAASAPPSAAIEVPKVAMPNAPKQLTASPALAANKLGKAIAIAVLGLSILGTAAWGWQWYQAEQQRQQELAAQQEQQRLAEEQARQAQQAAWQQAQQLGTTEAFEAYLDAYPDGLYAEAARSRLNAIALEEELKRKIAEQERLAKQQEAERQRQAKALRLAGEMVNIPGGTFTLGCTDSSGCNSRDLPATSIRIKSFKLAKYELTRARFAEFVRATGYQTRAETATNGQGCYDGARGRDEFWDYSAGVNWRNAKLLDTAQTDNHPVVCVSKLDADAYIEWLNKETGMQFRLPSEAEWEYAARAGGKAKFIHSELTSNLCSHENINDSTALSDGTQWISRAECTDGFPFTAPVGTFRANNFGLYDMLANVREITQDCWNSSLSGIPTNGQPRLTGTCDRVVTRGGNFNTSPDSLYIWNRSDPGSAFRAIHTGFRLAHD